MVVNDFKWQINYVRAIKCLLSCYQRLEKFNAIMCAKYHNQFLIYTSQHSDVTHSGQWTVTSLDVNVFWYVVVLFVGGVI